MICNFLMLVMPFYSSSRMPINYMPGILIDCLEFDILVSYLLSQEWVVQTTSYDDCSLKIYFDVHTGHCFSLHCYEKCWPRVKNCTHCNTSKCYTQLAIWVFEMETIWAEASSYLHAWRCSTVCLLCYLFDYCI